MNFEHAAYVGARRSVHCYFYDVKTGDVNREDQFNARTVEGTRSFHQVLSVGLDKVSLRVRNLSCFCKYCTNGGDGTCDSIAYIPPYTCIRIEPCNANDARVDAEPVPVVAGPDCQGVATTVEVGEHFAVVAEEGNSEGVDFWIFVCQEPLHEVRQNSENAWGQKVYRGEHIVIGTYYEQRGTCKDSYVLCDTNKLAFIYSHLVAAKFTVSMATHRQRGRRGGIQVAGDVGCLKLSVTG